MTTAKMVVELEWDIEELGPAWLNLSNLKMLLFTPTSSKEELIKVTEVSHSELPDGSA